MTYVRSEKRGNKWVKADSGYVCVYAPDHPAASGGWVYEHRLVMEDCIGRYLTPDEQVHHRNGNKQDNSPDNLELWTTSQPAGQRVIDRISDAISTLNKYEGFVPPPPRGVLLWAAVDFDGTLCHSTWSVDNPLAVPGPPIWDNVTKLMVLVRKGYKIVIHTSRGSTDYELIEAWMNYYEIPFDKIVTGKVLAKIYVDDRAVHADEEVWG
jgi:HNH endonuclease